MANEITDKWALTGLLDTIPLINQDIVAASLEEMFLLLKDNSESSSIPYDQKYYSQFVPSIILPVVVLLYTSNLAKIPKMSGLLKTYFKYITSEKPIKNISAIISDDEITLAQGILSYYKTL